MSSIISKFCNALTESVQNLRRAHREGVVTVSGAEGSWALKAGDRVKDAEGNDGTVRLNTAGKKSIQFAPYGPVTPLKNVSYPVTFKR